MLLHTSIFCATVALVVVSAFVPAAAVAARIRNFAHNTFPETRLSKDVCGLPPIKPDIGDSTGNIIGGKEAIPHSWPWMADIGISAGSTDGFQHMFAGSLLTKRWVVTVAHYFKDFSGDGKLGSKPLLLRVGEHDEAQAVPPMVTVKAKSIHVHEKFNPSTAENDIALIELSTDIAFNDFVQPVCLPTTDFKAGTMCATTGWGGTEGVNGGFTKLQEVALPIYSHTDCVKDYNDSQMYFPVTDGMICAGFPEGGKSPCHGDGGGPLVCHGSDGVWQLVGITSWVSDCGQPNFPAVFTRVDKYNEWIRNIIG